MALTSEQKTKLNLMCKAANDGLLGDTIGALEDALPTGSVVGTSDTQTLSNKTLTEPIIDDTDAGITITSADQTHATPVATIPDIGDAADTFVMVDTAQTLTNKTLTSPVITTMLVDDGDAGLTVTSANQTNAAPTATIPDLGDAADNFVMEDVAQTLTSKTLRSPLIYDGDAGVTLTSADQTNASATVTIPDIGDAADNFVMEDTAQTLTNKTLTSPVITTMLVDDGDAGLTVTSANQTNAAPTATIPDLGDAADNFVMEDVSQTLTNKTIDGDDNTLSDIATSSLKSVTGADTAVVTGTAGSDGYIAIWNGDGDAVTGTSTDTQVATAVEKSTYGMRMYYLGTPELDDADQVVTSTNMVVGTYTVAADPDVPRVITVTHASVGATDTLGTITVEGTDFAGTVISEVITPSADTTVTGLLAFATVTSVTGVDWVIAEGNDTIEVGTGPALGLPEVVAVSTTNAYAKLALVDEAISAVGTHAALSTTTVTLTSALNGSSVYIQTNA